MAQLLRGGEQQQQQQQQQRTPAAAARRAAVMAAAAKAADAAASDELAEATANAQRSELEVQKLKVEVMSLSARLYFAEDQLAAYKERFGEL